MTNSTMNHQICTNLSNVSTRKAWSLLTASRITLKGLCSLFTSSNCPFGKGDGCKVIDKLLGCVVIPLGLINSEQEWANCWTASNEAPSLHHDDSLFSSIFFFSSRKRMEEKKFQTRLSFCSSMDHTVAKFFFFSGARILIEMVGQLVRDECIYDDMLVVMITKE